MILTSLNDRVNDWAERNSKKLKILYVLWSIAIVLVVVAFTLGDFEINFDANKVPVGLMDTSYCKVFLSNGKCVFEKDWKYVNSINFWTECSEGYNEKYNPFYGRYCKVDTSNRPPTQDIICGFFGGDCYSIGLVKNDDRSIPVGYIPDDVIQEISDSALNMSIKTSDTLP